MPKYKALSEAYIPELPNYYKGKVRENYDLPDGRRIIIATDRISAFDRILASIPLKGQVLTQTARFQFEQTQDICPNHVIEYPDPNVLVCRKLTILPVEIVVRSYLAGTTGTSILTLYKAGKREMYGFTLPDGMQDNEKLPAPIITPTSKAFDGGHDEPLTAGDILKQQLLTEEQWETITGYALKLFARGQEIAASRGLILADTKYEFGTDDEGKIVLADEIHTPDSSRYWFADSHAPGKRPVSFDKDFVRNWVVERCDPYKDDIPEIPEDVIDATTQVYIQAYEKITDRKFAAGDPAVDPLQRIRNNLAKYF
ncbi:phosphoribosylaminoimidazolesuccinocarboxamide synthase [Phyllobacterium chamaecytisi]|uniref:phosphoribosylaminoimidazolesuccinocarboxamide synthase n=1 Tax=Phyllobacterium chamaecytisi TaxID=2876082 RepID=UPI001CCE2E2E|nr:phosphoribosylaminoimidazolesuccinocarboxamide synthase [Phyllobacterium sp. KW56]MBZ9604549.1 phosphoribosylaminoimidazolesuccinocarboxamide synthase [Phyllobacterium sp. KW56]